MDLLNALVPPAFGEAKVIKNRNRLIFPKQLRHKIRVTRRIDLALADGLQQHFGADLGCDDDSPPSGDTVASGDDVPRPDDEANAVEHAAVEIGLELKAV
jgi:hypothetical protein